MSVESALARVGALQQALAEPSALVQAARTGGTAAPAAPVLEGTEEDGAQGSFAAQLQSASDGYSQQPAGASAAYTPASAGTYSSAATPAGYSGLATGALSTDPLSAGALSQGIAGTSPGARVVQAAQTQVGQAEQPPGSNEGAAIAAYRGAVAGSAPGEPWCAYFASWAAREAGVPLGASGEGLGSVSQIWSWAQSTGRAIPNGPGVTPQPGDLIVFGSEHVGIVKDVLPNGQIQTIEGNYENKVAENVRSPSEATGYVQLG